MQFTSVSFQRTEHSQEHFLTKRQTFQLTAIMLLIISSENPSMPNQPCLPVKLNNLMETSHKSLSTEH